MCTRFFRQSSLNALRALCVIQTDFACLRGGLRLLTAKSARRAERCCSLSCETLALRVPPRAELELPALAGERSLQGRDRRVRAEEAGGKGRPYRLPSRSASSSGLPGGQFVERSW